MFKGEKGLNSVDIFIDIQENGQMPVYASPGSAGCDLFAGQDITLRPGERKIIPACFRMALPEGVEAQIRPRSGMSLKTTLRLSNSPGTVDNDYRDAVGIIVENTFSNENLIEMLKRDSSLWNKIMEQYKKIPLAKYLGINDSLQGDILIDSSGCPYGTIFIKKGERIAQMVLSQYVRGNFVLHGHVEQIGRDRGGGFGHTGI